MKALDLAKYILTKCYDDVNLITHMHLQIILWLLFEDVYKTYNVFLFIDRLEARPYGPYLPVVYGRFWHNGAFEICDEFHDIDYKFDVPKEYIDKKIEEYRDANIFELIKRSCDNEPYKIIREKYPDNPHARIPLELIKQYL